jgi:hypothetical protein
MYVAPQPGQGFKKMSRTPIADGEIRRLTKAQRDLLIDHVDGEVPVILANNHYISTIRNSLMKMGLLKSSTPHTNWPRATLLTERGRLALSMVLADYADALVRAGLFPEPLNALAVLRSLKAGRTPSDSAQTAPEPAALPRLASAK